MSFIANPFVVLLDANVLFPFRVRDVLPKSQDNSGSRNRYHL